MSKNLCERCGRDNHLENECMSRTDINGNIIDEENTAEYVNLIIKDKSIIGILINKIKEFGKNIKKILEVPPSGKNL
jgi:hypothetical protein